MEEGNGGRINATYKQLEFEDKELNNNAVLNLHIFFHLLRAPSPTKRKEEEKSKDRGKEKTATKEGGDKERGREKGHKRRSASTGSSSR